MSGPKIGSEVSTYQRIQVNMTLNELRHEKTCFLHNIKEVKKILGFVLDMVRNPEDRFSHDEAHVKLTLNDWLGELRLMPYANNKVEDQFVKSEEHFFRLSLDLQELLLN